MIAEADILAFGSISHRQTQMIGLAAHLDLIQAAEREKGMAQLLLREGKEKVGLILCAILPAKKRRPAGHRIALNAGIVSRGDIVRALLPCPLHQNAKLEVAIASNARVGRAAVEVAARKRLRDLLGELGAEIEQGVRDAENVRDFRGASIVRTIFRILALVFPQAKRDSGYVIARFQKKPGRDRAIHPAAHGYDDFLFAMAKTHKLVNRKTLGVRGSPHSSLLTPYPLSSEFFSSSLTLRSASLSSACFSSSPPWRALRSLTRFSSRSTCSSALMSARCTGSGRSAELRSMIALPVRVCFASVFTTLPGTPTTVECGGTEVTSTEPAPTRLCRPTITGPRTAAPLKIVTESSIVGWRLMRCVDVPPSVTPW